MARGFVVAAVPGVAVSLAALRILPEPRRERPRAAPAGDENFADALRALLSLPSLRWLLAGAAFSAFAIFSVMAWLPVLFQRSFDWSATQTGVVLGPVIGISGLLGTWIGGVLGDRWQAREPRGQIRVARPTSLLAGPLFALAMGSDSGTVVLAVPCMLYAAFQASLAASVQNVVPSQHRALASALLTLAANLLGLRLGPTAVGSSSDALALRFGSDSLRVALLWVSVAGFAASALLWIARRSLRRQVVAMPGAESCPSPG